MKSIDCAWFSAVNGWRCVPIEGRGEDVLYVSSPISLSGGKPLDFYLVSRGDFIFFTDDALTVFALQSAGIEVSTRKNLKGVEAIVEKMGFSLEKDGAIEAIFPRAHAEWWIGMAVRMFSSIVDWQGERFEQHDQDFSLTDEVERILREKDPVRKITFSPKLSIRGGEYGFDFMWGETYIDAVSPTAQSVSARLRKAIMATQQDDEIDMLFILDDRFDSDRANRELPVLGQVARTVRFSDFSSPAFRFDRALPV